MTSPSQPPGGPSIEEVAHRVKAERIYKLSSNENPLGASPAVAAASARVTPMFHLYPPRGDDSLRAALTRHHGRGLTESHVFTACGGFEAIDLISRAFLRPADHVIICSPTFPVLAAVTPRTRIVYICNPNNPTGAMLSAPAMDSLLSALPGDVLVVADEVYCHYVSRSDYPDSIRYILAERPLVVLQSFSKVYGLAGLRLGYGIARPDLIAQLWRYRRNFHLGRLEIEAGIAALGDPEHVSRSVKLAQEGRTYLYAGLARLGVKFWPSEASNRVIASDLVNPDFRKLAEAFGAAGYRAETLSQLREALQKGFRSNLPTVIEVPCGEMPDVDRFRKLPRVRPPS